MRIRPVVLALLVVILVAGCAPIPPETYEFDPLTVVNADYDAVWDAVVEFFVLSGLLVEVVEKESGLIVTSWMNASRFRSGPEDRTYCDCGSPHGLDPDAVWTRGKFTILVKPAAGGETELRVTCLYQQKGGFGQCSSTGYLEGRVHAYVHAKVQGEEAPQVPSLRPLGQG